MRNVTIALPEEVARWARVQAAKQGKSLSCFVRDLLAAEMPRETAYEEAMRNYMSMHVLPGSGGPPRPREPH